MVPNRKYRNFGNFSSVWSCTAIIKWCLLVLGQIQFAGSEFWIFGGFGWVCSSILVGKPRFERVWIKFGSNQFEVRYFWVQPNTNHYQELSEYVISSSRANYFTRLLSFGISVKYKYCTMNNFFSSEDSQPNMFKSETDNSI